MHNIFFVIFAIILPCPYRSTGNFVHKVAAPEGAVIIGMKHESLDGSNIPSPSTEAALVEMCDFSLQDSALLER